MKYMHIVLIRINNESMKLCYSTHINVDLFLHPLETSIRNARCSRKYCTYIINGYNVKLSLLSVLSNPENLFIEGSLSSIDYPKLDITYYAVLMHQNIRLIIFYWRISLALLPNGNNNTLIIGSKSQSTICWTRKNLIARSGTSAATKSVSA